MSYADIESSVDGGKPIFLYEFKQGINTASRYTSDLYALTFNAFNWTPLQIRHSEPTLKGEVASDTLRIEMPITESFAADFLGYQPDLRTSLTIYRKQRNADDYRVVWKGYVGTPTVDETVLSIECSTLAVWLKQYGLQSKMTRPCRHVVYFGKCLADPDLHSTLVTITGVSGRVVSITDPGGLPIGTLTGGVLQAANGERRMIMAHSSGSLVLSRPISGLTAGTCTCLRGCARTRAACAEFSNPDNDSGTNIENFGGFPWIPTRNPFNGGSAL